MPLMKTAPASTRAANFSADATSRVQTLDPRPYGDALANRNASSRSAARITAAALERGNLVYVGLIGSRSKRRRFERAFREVGIPEERIAALVCPIGDRGVRDKRPAVIAALAAAELVEVFATERATQRREYKNAPKEEAA